MTVEEATTTADVDRLRPEWEHLWAADPTATPFQHPAWLIPWWKHVAEGDLWTLAARDPAGQLVGVLPLYVYTQPTGSRDALLLGIATSDYLDALVRPGHDPLPALIDHLHHHRRRWDALDLRPLRPASPLLTVASPWWEERTEGEPCPVLPLPVALSENMAQNLRYYRRRADRLGATIEPADGRNLDEMYDALRRLHAARWASRGEPGVLAPATVQAAHAESLPQLLSAGLLRLYGLRVDGRFTAGLYGLADRRRVYYYLGGFDPAFKAISPGTLLIGHAIEQATAAGAEAFDFLKGREPYKYLWGATDTPTFARRLEQDRRPGSVTDAAAAGGVA